MFGPLKKKTYQIVFDESNKDQFIDLLTEIYKILWDFAFTAQANWINQILSAVHNEDQEIFIQKVISVEFLGGAGSVVDIWIEEDEKMQRLDDLRNVFLELAIRSGLNHREIKSRMTR